MKQPYYVDSCIYLNLWKKESNKTGIPLWIFARDFFEKARIKRSVIFYSGYLLKELSFKINKDIFIKKLKMFEYSSNFKRVNLSREEYELARKIDRKTGDEIGFFDIIHLLLAKKTGSVLITRDNKLIKFAKKYFVKSKKPEELI